MITTVVFDLDDTLYNETDYCKSGFLAVSDYLSQKPPYPDKNRLFEAFWSQFMAGQHNYLFDTVLATLNLPCEPALIQELVTVYRNHSPIIKLPDSSKRLLDSLKSKYDLALLTDGFMPAQKLKVQALGIESYFKCIIYTELLGRQYWKPSTVGFEKLIAEMRAAAENCVYLGDNPVKDFLPGNKLGFKTVQLRCPSSIHNLPAPEDAAKPQYIIDSLDQLEELLTTL